MSYNCLHRSHNEIEVLVRKTVKDETTGSLGIDRIILT
jgi:hypothetical protein